MPEPELHYYCAPEGDVPVDLSVEFLPVQDFLADEPACKTLWDLIGTTFRTRSKFLTVWPGVRYVALHRGPGGSVDGLLLVTAPINWQIDYVVVRPEARGCGIAGDLVRATLNEAYARKVPYVMLTSREGLRPLYEGRCGFTVVSAPALVG
jgi:ribosomal protein S18 acetylase RimI-like enzyme